MGKARGSLAVAMGLLPDPLHPAVVHFPIALTMVALLFELAGRYPRLRGLSGGGLVLAVLAAVAGLAAVATGNLAHDAAVVPVEARELLERHEELGELLMWSLLAAAGLRVVLEVKGWHSGWRAWLMVVVLAIVAGMAAVNGHLGGSLVFDHGLGVLG